MTDTERAELRGKLETYMRTMDLDAYEAQRMRERILEILPEGCALDTLELAEEIDGEEVEPGSVFHQRTARICVQLTREGIFERCMVGWLRVRGGR